MRKILTTLLICLCNISGYACLDSFFEENSKYSSLNSSTSIKTNDSFPVFKVPVMTKWEQVEKEIWEYLINESRGRREKKDLAAIINCLVTRLNYQDTFRSIIEQSFRSNNPDYYDYFFYRCNQILKEANGIEGIDKMRQRSMQEYWQFLRDSLRKPLEFYEKPNS